MAMVEMGHKEGEVVAKWGDNASGRRLRPFIWSSLGKIEGVRKKLCRRVEPYIATLLKKYATKGISSATV